MNAVVEMIMILSTYIMTWRTAKDTLLSYIEERLCNWRRSHILFVTFGAFGAR